MSPELSLFLALLFILAMALVWQNMQEDKRPVFRPGCSECEQAQRVATRNEERRRRPELPRVTSWAEDVLKTTPPKKKDDDDQPPAGGAAA